MKTHKYIPFSKKNIIYARVEAYVFSFILILMVWFGRDVSAIAILLSLAWAGYKTLQCFYIKMAEREHLEELRQSRCIKKISTSDLDSKIEELENTPIESEVF